MSRHGERLAACWQRIAVGRTGRPSSDAPGRPADGGNSRLGSYTLRPAQLAAVRGIRAAFKVHGGALLADPPGAGKTLVALAVAREAPDALVVGPASLRAQWERSAVRAEVPARFVSFESLSRGARPAILRGGTVVVDEAHHVRTPGTRRHAMLAELCTGAHVLLLSATPVINRATDREALLALFLGSRAGSEHRVGVSCIIRRRDLTPGMPTLRRLPPLSVPALAIERQVADSIALLPPPLPAADGTAALALIRITLAMAWGSSLAALAAALRRRVQRGESLADSLAAGEWPTRAALRHWVVGDDATQLAFPGLDASAATPPSEAAPLLARHLDAVRALRALITNHVAVDTAARAAAIDALQHARPLERVVVFARHAETIRALWLALRAAGGVVAIAGERVMAAQGRWTRDEVLGALGPRPRALRRSDPRQVRILLSTDLLSEGIELQGVTTVVHADSAWTPATMEQREGRVARPGRGTRSRGSRRDSNHEVLVTRFEAPAQARPLLQLSRRLAAKDHARARAVRRAECEAATGQAFASWLPARRGESGRSGRTSEDSQSHAKACDSFLAAVRLPGGEEQLLAGRLREGQWRVTRSPCAIASLARLATATAAAAAADAGDHANEREDHRVACDIRRALARHLRRAATGRLLGDGGRAAAAATPWRGAYAAIDRILAGSSIVERARCGEVLPRALASLERSAGAAVERQVRVLLRALRAGGLSARAFEAQLCTLAARSTRDGGGPGVAPASSRGVGSDHDADTAPRPALLALVLVAAGTVPTAPDQLRRSPAPSS